MLSPFTINSLRPRDVHMHQWTHDDVIEWKNFPRYWPFVRGIHRSSVNSPLKGQWHGALMFSLICALINPWVNNHETGTLRRHRAHCDATVMHASIALDNDLTPIRIVRSNAGLLLIWKIRNTSNSNLNKNTTTFIIFILESALEIA